MFFFRWLSGADPSGESSHGSRRTEKASARRSVEPPFCRSFFAEHRVSVFLSVQPYAGHAPAMRFQGDLHQPHRGALPGPGALGVNVTLFAGTGQALIHSFHSPREVDTQFIKQPLLGSQQKQRSQTFEKGGCPGSSSITHSKKRKQRCSTNTLLGSSRYHSVRFRRIQCWISCCTQYLSRTHRAFECLREKEDFVL